MAAGINYTCPDCRKKHRIEIPEIDRLRRRVVELEMRLKGRSDLDALKNLFGMKGR